MAQQEVNRTTFGREHACRADEHHYGTLGALLLVIGPVSLRWSRLRYQFAVLC